MKNNNIVKINKNKNSSRRRKAKGYIQFLALPNEIIAYIFDYYLSSHELDPVIPLLVCKRIFNIIVQSNFLFHLTSKYIGNKFVTNSLLTWGTSKQEKQYKKSKTYKLVDYYCYDNNLIAWNKLQWYDNLNIKFDNTFGNPDLNPMYKCCIIYHIQEDISVNSLKFILKELKENNKGYAKYGLYKHMTVIQYFISDARNFIKLHEERREKNIKTFLRFRAPLQSAKKATDDKKIKDFSGTVEYNITNRQLDSYYFEHILSYGNTLFKLIGPDLVRKLFDAMVLNMSPIYHVDCICIITFLTENIRLIRIFERSVLKLTKLGYHVSSDINLAVQPLKIINKLPSAWYENNIFMKKSYSFNINMERIPNFTGFLKQLIIKFYGLRCCGCFNFVPASDHIGIKKWTNNHHHFDCKTPLCASCIDYAQNYVFPENANCENSEETKEELIPLPSGIQITKLDICNCINIPLIAAQENHEENNI
jgi:hypothetical protein